MEARVSNRYYHLFRNWVGKTGGFEVKEESKENKHRAALNCDYGSKTEAVNEETQSAVGVVSSIPSLGEFLKPLNELPNDVYLDIISRYKCLLHELKIRLIEIFKRNSDKYKLQYKLDIVDERMSIIKELGKDIFKLSPQDLSDIYTQRDKEECLMVEKLMPVGEKIEGFIDYEEESFLLDLNQQLRNRLNMLNDELIRFQNQIDKIEEELKDADETSNNFIIDAIHTFKNWSKNSMDIIRAVEKAS